MKILFLVDQLTGSKAKTMAYNFSESGAPTTFSIYNTFCKNKNVSN